MDYFTLTPSRTHACILSACSDPCLHPGEHLRERVHVRVAEDAGPLKGFGTWLAEKAELVAVCKYHGQTLVYITSQDTFYFASPSVLLSAECPDKTTAIGQFVIDNDQTPRLLLFDLVRLQGVAMKDIPAQERYACLQRLQPSFGPMCSLQWAGECAVLAAEMRQGKFAVPHEVKGIMMLGPVPGEVRVAKK